MRGVREFAGFIVVTLALSSAPVHAQNVAQADMDGVTAANCPSVSSTIPGLALELKTSGRPVLLSFVIGFAGNANAAIYVAPIIDGVRDTDRQLDRSINVPQSDSVSFSRVYDLPKGTHTFALDYICQAQILVTRGWLVAQELGK